MDMFILGVTFAACASAVFGMNLQSGISFCFSSSKMLARLTAARLTLAGLKIALPLGLGIQDTWLHMTAFGRANVSRANKPHANVIATVFLSQGCKGGRTKRRDKNLMSK